MTHLTPVSPDPVVLRGELRKADVEAVREIVAATGMFTPEEIAVAAELVQETLLRGDAAGYRFHFADIGRRVVGYACYGPIPLTVESFDLYWIAVHPSCQNRGIGAQLMSAAESATAREGGRRLYVDTAGRDQYAPTRAFYERLGYRREATLADFYAPGDAKVIYLKQLTSPTARRK